ncbi:DUF2617 family protein [Mycobacterium sp.]|uniref:DUF2617 family protein n=1 Tax=Mycobacterium sp. TaxID=1785 RepID=UPI003A8C04F3
MPLHRLYVTPADVSGARLLLALNAPAPRPLVSCRLEHPAGGTLWMGVLGASHVVVAEHGAVRFSEQVSCIGGGDLPERSDTPGYRIESQTASPDQALFRSLADELRQRCAQETGWLGGIFPGDDAALTVLAAEPDGDGWRWQTWHLYPAQPAAAKGMAGAGSAADAGDAGDAGGTVVHTASRWRP